jgi:hypothetical protein
MRDISAICPLRLLSRQRQSTQTIPVAALPVPGSSAPGCLCASTRPGSSQLSAASSAPRTGSSVHWSPSANKSATSPPGRVAPRDGHQTTLTATIGDNEAAVGFPNRLFGPLSVVVLRPGQLQARPAAASRPRPLPWPSPTSRPGIPVPHPGPPRHSRPAACPCRTIASRFTQYSCSSWIPGTIRAGHPGFPGRASDGVAFPGNVGGG